MPADASRAVLPEAALACAARGWHVFPVRPGNKRPAFPDHTAERCTGTDPAAGPAFRVPHLERRTTSVERHTTGENLDEVIEWVA